jgi:type III secretion protein V
MVAGTEKDPLTLAEFVRGQLRRPITFRLTRGATHLGVLLLDAPIEDTVRRAITRTPSGAFLSLPPPQARELLVAIKRAIFEGRAALPDGPQVILTQPDIRRFVRKLVEAELSDVHVVSFAELLPEVALRPVAKAMLAAPGT